jgi:[acyl-carrier-protein] S-malonyltransferase
MLTAWTFPGHGSQSPGMGHQLMLDYPRARGVLRFAEEISGLPLDSLRKSGPSRELLRPSVAEPLITAIGIGYVDLLFSLGLRPDAVAGYSAGEIVAYYASGVFDLDTALQVATIRGQEFENYVSDNHRMVAITGIEFEHVQRVVSQLQLEGMEIYIAGRNAPSHSTIVGRDVDVIRAESELIRMGAESSMVNAGGLWHTPQLVEASHHLAKTFKTTRFSHPLIPVFTSRSGNEQSNVSVLKHDLAFGVSQPVMWQPIVEQLIELGVSRFIECGSGRVLFGMMRWNNLDPERYYSICVEDRNGGLRPLRRFATQEVSRAERRYENE